MKNIHLIPTDKPSRLGQVNGELSFFKDRTWDNTENWRCKNIYITSDEALPYDSSVFDNGAFYHRDAAGDVHIITKHTFKPNPRFCKRIILTTDQDLIADGVQAIDDEFLEWFVKNPSCEWVETYHVGYVNVYNIIIPKEEPNPHILSCCRTKEECHCGKYSKQETIEEAAERYANDWEEIHPTLDSENMTPIAVSKIDFIAGAKWQAERMYSEEEVLKSFDNLGFKKITSEELNSLSYKPFITDEDGNIWIIDKEKWFEQFKKK